MIGLLIRVIINAAALWVATLLLPGMEVSSASAAAATVNADVGQILAFLTIGLVFGAVNAVVKPIISLLSLPLTCLTLGLFTIIINAIMLMLTVWLTSFLPVSLTIDSFFWTAVLAAIIVSLVSMLANGLVGTVRKPSTR
ncbi:phage holin family protein [Micrococcus terreus]|uniref:phage holin family protein n=1 Tax=Micrococcus terreus TaxID=574650 RepID=UPI0021A7A0A0|nr:phage holin family protein [Micrococcus terreus]MCT2090095.1 phage holin family protein [Micrococcus terreus]MDK7701048.1 phage holin family protein [Micrococcus terreus]WOO96806.1 phage holin family protein [Micrococcus terreus]